MYFPLDLAIFAAAGFLLKISDILGELNRSKVLSTAPALLAAAFFWTLMKFNAEYSAVLLAIVIGSLVSKKVDRINLIAGLGLLLALMAVYGFTLPLLLPLTILAVSATVDEWGHDGRWLLSKADWLFRYRGMMKTFAVILGIIGQLSFFTVAGFFLFDLTYDVTSIAIERKTRLTPKLSPPIIV